MMPNSFSNVDLSESPVDLTTRRVPHEARQQPLDDHAPTVPTESQDQIDRDVPHIAVEPAVNQAQELKLLQHRPPVTRIPPEILTYIFELYVVRLSELTPGGVRSQGLSCLTQVCTLWRAVAESDPHLWTSIRFYFPESQQNREKDVPSVEAVLDQHLTRSGAELPISLTFTDHRAYHAATEDLVALLVDRLRMHAPRWKRITLHLSSIYFPWLFELTPCDLSSLERLSISGDVPMEVDRPELGLNLESAINLKSFIYSGPGPSAIEGIHLHWDSLAEVSFEFVPHKGMSYTLSRQFRYLAQCQNITTCSLGIDRTPRRITDQTITLPHLHTLRVRRLSPYAQARAVINPLTLPRLQTLEIDASILVGWNPRWHNRNFSNLLARSGCRLLHLSIQDVDFPNDELLRCLAFSPTLTSLRFIPCPRSQKISDVIREIDVSRIGQTREGYVAKAVPLVPQLREITLASSIEEYLEQMSMMFHSRVGARAHAAGVATLRRAEVVFFDLWHKTDVSRVCGPGHRLERVASFCADHARWASENSDENVEDRLEASVVVDSPYLPEYIDVQ